MPSALNVLALCLISTTIIAARGRTTYPLLGQLYPTPINLSSETAFQAATKSITAKLNELTKTAAYNTSTFSIGLFNAADDGLLYEYNFAAPSLTNSSQGTRSVDSDSIYRIGSVSKLLTMYVWLISQGDQLFSDPISKYVPQLSGSSSSESHTPAWDNITIGDLAGQMAGIARDYGLDDVSQHNNGLLPIPKDVAAAFPKIPASQIPPCGYLEANYTFVACTAQQYLHGAATEAAIFPTAYTPVYSNEAFAILGIALSNIAGRAIEDLFEEDLVHALGLNGTYFDGPIPSSPRNVNTGPLSGFRNNFGVFSPAGGYFSTVNDFAVIGKSMLNSQLVPKSVMDRWLKPTSFAEPMNQAVGRPWEIYRRKVNKQVIDLYTKGGDWGVYHSMFGLSPTYGFGVVVLTAGDPANDLAEAVRGALPEIILDPILPVLDSIAQSQAATNFGGTYTDASTNSSITLATRGDNPGLFVEKWISNGVDFLTKFWEAEAGKPLSYRIIPNHLGTGNQTGFTSFYENPSAPPSSANWYLYSPGWYDVDELVFGNVPLGQLYCILDGSGKATSVDLTALRSTLQRT